MKFNFTEEHLLIQQTARHFANNECKPGVFTNN